MIIDSSAIIAILTDEPEALQFSEALVASPIRRLSAGTWIELSVVITRRFTPELFAQLDALMSAYGIAIAPITTEQARIGRDAYRRYGRGNDPLARLNFGVCFPYALAKELGEPLLFKGDDFIHTDVTPAIPR